MDGKLVPWDQALVHVLTHGLHYGYAVFEGIRCHRTERGSAIFRLDEHLTRFLESAMVYRMKMPFDLPTLRRGTVDLIAANSVPEAYLRPIAFSGYGQMGLDPTQSKVQVAIGMWEWGAYLGAPGVANGVRATVSSWVRMDSRSLPPQAKCAANYANSALAKMEAISGGYRRSDPPQFRGARGGRPRGEHLPREARYRQHPSRQLGHPPGRDPRHRHPVPRR